MANDLLAPERTGRAGQSGGIFFGLGRRPPCAPSEAGREADANSRAASPRGCSRHRTLPLAAEPRG